MSDTPTPPAPGEPTPAAPAAPAATAAPAAPAAPAGMLPPPLPLATNTPRNRARTGTIIGVVIGVVVGGGGVAGLLNSLGGDDASAAQTPLEITQPTPTAPTLPGAGSVGTPVTLPGPALQPPVTTAPAVTPSTAPAPAPDTAPDLTAPPISDLPTTTAPAAPIGELVDLGAGVKFAVPAGWQLLSAADGSAELTNGNASIYVVLTNASSASDLLFAYQSFLGDVVAGLEVGEIETAGAASNVVVDAALFGYTGYIGQGQSGSTTVAGTVFADVRVDDVGIVTDVMWAPDDNGGLSAADSDGIVEFLSSFVYGS